MELNWEPHLRDLLTNGSIVPRNIAIELYIYTKTTRLQFSKPINFWKTFLKVLHILNTILTIDSVLFRKLNMRHIVCMSWIRTLCDYLCSVCMCKGHPLSYELV